MVLNLFIAESSIIILQQIRYFPSRAIFFFLLILFSHRTFNPGFSGCELDIASAACQRSTLRDPVAQAVLR